MKRLFPAPLLSLSLFVLWLVLDFHALSWWVIVPAALLYSVSLSWSINSISHNQIHNAYFTPGWMNRAFDLLLSVTIGFSQTLYRDIHNRHHRGNSDLPDAHGKTVDPLSIYLHGKNGQPDNPWAYTFLSFFRDDPKEIYQEMQRKRPDDARWVKVEIGVTVAFYLALALFVADNFQHMHTEETVHNSALWAAYSDAELIGIHDALVATIPPAEMMLVMRWMLPQLNAPERLEVMQGMRAGAPAPVFEGMLTGTQGLLNQRDWAKLARGLGLPPVPGLVTV